VQQHMKQYLQDQFACMLEEIGQESLHDREVANRRALEWVARNAARYRAEWFARRGLPQPQPAPATVRAS